jgi:S-DNA-T family DNA segregation ATPase FtsK/SpoIIIE
MARKAASKSTSAKTKSSGRGKGRPSYETARPLLSWQTAWKIILAVVIIGVMAWQWPNITASASAAADNVLRLFGMGLPLLIVGITIMTIVLVKRKAPGLVRFRQWWGGLLLIFAVWGMLAYGGLGGTLGLGLISFQDSTVVGIPRIIGLIVAGIALIAPQAFAAAVRKGTAAIDRQLEKQAAAKAAAEKEKLAQKPLARPATPLLSPLESREAATSVPPTPQKAALPPVRAPMPGLADLPETPASAAAAKASAPATSTPATKEELKQVAQEVWKKYGESPALVREDGWRLPPIDILDKAADMEVSPTDNMKKAHIIEEALASYGVDAHVVQINAGPTVTQFGMEPGWDRKFKEIKEKDKDGNVTVRTEEVGKTRVKVERISGLANDLALALAAPSIRIEAPVPGTSMVGIEVPNSNIGTVNLRGVIETTPFQKLLTKSRLTVALGKGAGGEPVVGDLAKMPHLLIAGATGSGKTVCLNAIICCLLLNNSPQSVRFIMVDPKRVELTPYNSIPHLATPVVVDAKKAVDILRWLAMEMDRRYRQLATAGQRNIDGYNKVKSGTDRLPYLVLVVDELADLMMSGYEDVEHTICRLAQLARAVGIHLIVATQRPSVDVVTGLIKANFPTRISFAVTSQVDSRTILDIVGAEKLLGRGDMLYMPTDASKPKRLQGCYVSDPETERLVYFWSSQKKAGMLNIPELAAVDVTTPPTTREREVFDEDPIKEAARKLMQEHDGNISTSFLQRKLRIGYPRAARIMEELQEEELGGKDDKEEDEGEEE